MLSANLPDNQIDRDGQQKLIKDCAVGLADAAREKRESINVRLKEAKKIIDKSPDDHFILWHDLEAERHEIHKEIPEAKFIFGQQDLEEREKKHNRLFKGRLSYPCHKKRTIRERM